MLDESAQSKVDYRREVDRLINAAGEGGEADWYGGKRHSTRVSEPIQLEVCEDLQVPGKSWPVSMHNISAGGFALWSKRKVEPKKRLYVREFTEYGSATWLPAYVTHCTVGIRGFLIGAAFIFD